MDPAAMTTGESGTDRPTEPLPEQPRRRRHLRRFALELVPVAILVAAAIPSVATEDLITAAGSLASMVAWCLLPSLLLLHFLVRSEWSHLVGVVLLVTLVANLLRVGAIEEPLGGLILLQLIVWAPLLAVAVVLVDAVISGVSGLRSRRVTG